MASGHARTLVGFDIQRTQQRSNLSTADAGQPVAQHGAGGGANPRRTLPQPTVQQQHPLGDAAREGTGHTGSVDARVVCIRAHDRTAEPYGERGEHSSMSLPQQDHPLNDAPRLSTGA